MNVDLAYLRLADSDGPEALLRNPDFIQAQNFFFDVLGDLNVSLSCDVADVREVHVMAALGHQLQGAKVIDVGCGSFEEYVKDTSDVRDRYPPLMAECLQRKGARVTGVDWRPNHRATYDHCVLNVAKRNWLEALDAPYDLVICFSLFNAPDAPFKDDQVLSHQLMNNLCALMDNESILIATLPERLFPQEEELAEWAQHVRSYLREFGLTLLHCGRTAVWATKQVA